MSNTNDLIRRGDAIDGVMGFMPVELEEDASPMEQVNYSAWETAIKCTISFLKTMPSAQPELIEQSAYVRGFEQGRTQGMIDANLQPNAINVVAGIDKYFVKYIEEIPSAQPDKDMIHLQKEQAYMQGWEDGRKVLLSVQPEIIRCKNCKYNPKDSWFGCPMSHLSEEQRETAWCWKWERKDDE